MPQYQGVWTLEQQAQAQSNQQWVTDPNFKNTTLLLQADGTGSGSQNNTFLDGSTNNFFITRNGNTTQGSFSPFSQAPGYWGNYFGSNNYLTVPYNANFLWSTGARTYEAWVYVTSVASNNAIFALTNLSSSNIWELYINTSSQVVFRYFTTSAQTITTTGTVPLNTWAHVAFVYDGTSAITIYINGVISGTGTKTGTPVTGSDQLCIGRTNVGTAGDVSFSGYISNARFTTTTVYTSAFTPQTTPLTAITNTTLLTCQSNRFVDNSASPATVTANGSPSVQAFGPFAPALQWTPDVVGGSGYFDGSDYLSLPAGSSWLFTGDHCLEAWVYWTTSAAAIIYATGGASSADQFLLSPPSEGIWWGTTSLSSSVFPQVNAWNHVCVTRQGSTIRRFLNGQLITTGTNASNIGSSTATPYIGARSGSSLYFNGYLSQLRIVNGSVPTTYQTSSTTINDQIFTPPTAPLTTSSQGATSGDVKLLFSATNAGIYDGKMANNLETVGNAQVATSPVKYGSGSMYFNGSTSYLRSQVTSPLFALGTSYTIEGWFYRLSNTSSGTYPNSLVLIGTQAIGVTCTGFFLTFNTSGVLNFYDGANATVITYANATTLIPLNQWNHIAIVRSGGGSNNVTLFVNGIAVSTGTSSSAQSTAQSFFIGGDTNGQGCFTGYMDDIRVTPGVARYFANFTPPQQALPRQ